MTADVEVGEVALHEVCLPHLRRIGDEGVASVMSAYNSVNGHLCAILVPGRSSRWLDKSRGLAKRVSLLD